MLFQNPSDKLVQPRAEKENSPHSCPVLSTTLAHPGLLGLKAKADSSRGPSPGMLKEGSHPRDTEEACKTTVAELQVFLSSCE